MDKFPYILALVFLIRFSQFLKKRVPFFEKSICYSYFFYSLNFGREGK